MLRDRSPAVLRKIIPIEVDYNAYDLNIDPDALDRLHAEVQVSEKFTMGMFIIKKSFTFFISSFVLNTNRSPSIS